MDGYEDYWNSRNSGSGGPGNGCLTVLFLGFAALIIQSLF